MRSIFKGVFIATQLNSTELNWPRWTAYSQVSHIFVYDGTTHDLQTESTVVHAVELSSVELSELCRYKWALRWHYDVKDIAHCVLLPIRSLQQLWPYLSPFWHNTRRWQTHSQIDIRHYMTARATLLSLTRLQSHGKNDTTADRTDTSMHWLPIRQRIVYKQCLMTYKAVHIDNQIISMN